MRSRNSEKTPEFRYHVSGTRMIFFQLAFVLLEKGQEDLLGQDHPGRLAPQPPRALPAPEALSQDEVHVADRDVILGQADEGKLAGDEAADQGHSDADRLFRRNVDLPLGNVAEFPQGLVDLHGRGLVAVDHHGKGLGLFLLAGQVDVIFNLVRRKDVFAK